LLTNAHDVQLTQLTSLAENQINRFVEGKSNDNKFEGGCLKFLSLLFESLHLNLSIDDFKLKTHSFCQNYFGFVVFNFKSRNNKTRECAQKVLETLFAFYYADDAIIDDKSFLVCCLISGLAAETTLAKASCIDAIAFILKQFSTQMTPTLIHSIMKIVILLVKEKQTEIFNSALKFMTRVLKRQQQSIILDNLPLIIESVFEWDAESAHKALAKIKNFISLLNRKFVR
jgi:hypothetical protein